MTLEEARRELGVSGRSTQAAIRSAFKRLALRHHPDRNPGKPDAAARFHRICVAHEILRGERAPDPSPPPPKRQQAWSRPWQRADKQRSSPSTARPEKWPSGEPIYYPTPEEIASLDTPRVGGTRRGAIVFLAIVFGLFGLLWFLGIMADQPPTELDPLRAKLRRDLGRPW